MKEITCDHNKKGVIASDEYYTPPEFVKRLGHFDTDPATPVNARWRTADVMYNKIDDGLTKEWQGRVFLNPPYSHPLIEEFMKRMGEHHNAIALIIPKFGTKMFREIIYPYCDAIFILKERVKFYNMDYIQQRSPVCQSMLVIYGKENILAVKNSGLQGQWLFPENNNTQCLHIIET